MKSQHERASVEQDRVAQQRSEEGQRYKEDLQLQLQEKELKSQHAYEEFLKDKLMVDEIVRRIYEEDQK